MLENFRGKMLEYEKVAREQSDELERKIRQRFDDPIAQCARWHHLNKGSGSSSQSQKIASAPGNRLRVANTLGGLTIPLVAAFGGLAL